jgi:DNA polymerase III delta subunit
MLHIITGTDAARIAEQGRERARDLAGEGADAFGLDTIREGDDVPPPTALGQVVQAILTPPFLGGRKTIWLKDFSAFPDEKKKGARGPLQAMFDRLIEVLEAGVPDGVAVLLTGPGMDKRKGLFKLGEKLGNVDVIDKPDIKQRGWQAAMARVLREKAGEKELRLSTEAVEHLTAVIGTETAAVDAHLEKLRCYLGAGQTVSGEDAQLLCQGDGETVFWAVTDAVGRRDLKAVLTEIETVLSLEKSPDSAVLRLVRQISGIFRQMLQARVLMLQLKVGARQLSRTLQGINDDKKFELAMAGLDIVGIHPFRCQKVAEQAEKYSGHELIDAVLGIRDVYRHCVSSGADNRVALESMLAATVGTRAR